MVQQQHKTMALLSESPSRQITVVDVYDLASAIGKDFEKLIEQFGTETVTELMPKVISALEMLEAFAGRNERENEEIVGLKQNVHRLETDKREKIEGRQKLEKEIEQVEENYRVEIQQLWDMVQKLQDENKRLSSSLQAQEASPAGAALTEHDWQVMMTLKETVDKQRDQLRQTERDNRERLEEIDAMQQQMDRISRINKELLRKNHAVQNQGRLLVEEKADMIAQIQARDRVIEELQHRLGETERQRKDLEQTRTTPEPPPAISHPSAQNLEKVLPSTDKSAPIGSLTPRKSVSASTPALPASPRKSLTASAATATTNASATPASGTSNADKGMLVELCDLLKSKFYYAPTPKDIPSPGQQVSAPKSMVQEQEELDRENSPRFTLRELREVLQEKNNLKARVMELEEELEQLRPPKARTPEEEELIYGPMPREPEEKLHPWKFHRRDSGVRKLLSSVLSRARPGMAPGAVMQQTAGGAQQLSPVAFELAQSACPSPDESSDTSSVTQEPTVPCHPGISWPQAPRPDALALGGTQFLDKLSDNGCPASSCVLSLDDVTGAAGSDAAFQFKRRPSLIKARAKIGKLFHVIGDKLHESIDNGSHSSVSPQSSSCRMYYYDF